jgi:transketolase C-terminal domain/subunit
MKRILLLLLSAFFFSTIASAQAPDLPATKGTSYGEKISSKDAISTDDVATVLKGKESADVKVKGKVADVCHARGCFLYLETAKGKIYIKTKDDKFFVPVAIQGKTVVVKGTASVDKESKEISIQATGILVI